MSLTKRQHACSRPSAYLAARVEDRGVSYAALNVPTALAEVFQATRIINTRRGSPYSTAWSPTRPLTLLDLTGTWPIQAERRTPSTPAGAIVTAREPGPFTRPDRISTACGITRP